jgi:hypothetical protein
VPSCTETELSLLAEFKNAMSSNEQNLETLQSNSSIMYNANNESRKEENFRMVSGHFLLG